MKKMSLVVNFLMAIFLLLPLDSYLFSGAYIKFTVSVVSSDWE
jgi:hypothetical protein